MSDQLLEKLMRENVELRAAQPASPPHEGCLSRVLLWLIAVAGFVVVGLLLARFLPEVVAIYAPAMLPENIEIRDVVRETIAPGQFATPTAYASRQQPAQVQAPPAAVPTVATQPTVAAPTVVAPTAPPIVEDAEGAGQPAVLLPGGDVVWPTPAILGLSETLDEVREQATAAAQEIEVLDLGPIPGFGP